jgi:hypothetical protein
MIARTPRATILTFPGEPKSGSQFAQAGRVEYWMPRVKFG